jgi:predicted metalloprotease with PDZ domain
MKKIACFFCILLILGFTAYAETLQPAATYTVSLSSEDRRLVKVEAEIFPTGNTLIVCPEGANHLPDKWATFMRNVSAKDENNQPVKFQYLGGGVWQITEPLPKKLVLNYEVEIKHDLTNWTFGYKEAAYVRDDSVFLTGASLFITMLELENMKIQFKMPSDWKVTVAWQEISNEKNAFRAANAEELLWIGMLAGKHLERKTKVGQLEVIMAVGQDLRQSSEMFDRAVKAIVPAYVKTYGGEPVFQGLPVKKFVIVANIDKTYVGGGAVFVRTISMMLKDVPQETKAASTSSWSHIITHELGHLWNGQSIREENQEFWFVEGVTDYLAYLLEARVGLISKAELLKVFAKKFDEYKPVAGKTALRKAGINKAKHYDLIYSGGLVAALALDIEIRKATKNQKGLVDLLRFMYRDFALKDKKYTVAAVRKIAEQISNQDFSDFFADYVEGVKILPLEKYADSLGLALSTNQNKTILEKKAKINSFEKTTLLKVTGFSY